MLIRTIKIAMAVMILAFGFPMLSAQEIVHAMPGTITAINSASLTLKLSDGTTNTFTLRRPLSTRFFFDKTLRADSVTASELPKGDDNVIVYYFGIAPETVVSVKDLGKDAVQATGVITHFDKSRHTIAIKLDSGREETCFISTDTSVEMSTGVVDGSKYSPRDGEKVKVICSDEAGRETAQFIRSFDD